MVSFDIEGLFASMPLEECVGLAVKCICGGGPGLGLSRTELGGLFSVAAARAHFLFGHSVCG